MKTDDEKWTELLNVVELFMGRNSDTYKTVVWNKDNGKTPEQVMDALKELLWRQGR